MKIGSYFFNNFLLFNCYFIEKFNVNIYEKNNKTKLNLT